MNAVLLVSGLVAIAAANAAGWWYRGRHQTARIRSLRRQRDHYGRWHDYWRGRAEPAEQALSTAAGKATALEERNAMLTDLIGGDRA
ncbi:hypothetical protein [Nonomuraea angiospora]